MLETLDRVRPVHFVGVGGSSMSGLTLMLHRLGYLVTGSDLNSGVNVQCLRDAGIGVATLHRPDHLPDAAQLVVVSGSIGVDNPEVCAARSAHVPVIDRSELLGALMAGYSGSVGVAGTRGKSTTAALVAQILEAAGADPAVSIGTAVSSNGGNFRVGSGDYFVAEACEYRHAFLNLSPSVVTSDTAKYSGTARRLVVPVLSQLI